MKFRALQEVHGEFQPWSGKTLVDESRFPKTGDSLVHQDCNPPLKNSPKVIEGWHYLIAMLWIASKQYHSISNLFRRRVERCWEGSALALERVQKRRFGTRSQASLRNAPDNYDLHPRLRPIIIIITTTITITIIIMFLLCRRHHRSSPSPSPSPPSSPSSSSSTTTSTSTSNIISSINLSISISIIIIIITIT